MRVLRLKQVCAEVGLSRSTIYEMVARGAFPRPVKLTDRAVGGAVGWLSDQIAEWTESRPSAARARPCTTESN